MLGTQIAFTVISAIAALVIAYSTWTFHQWNKKKHQPDPVLASQLIVIDAEDAEEVSVRARVSFLNPGPIPIYIERVGMGIRGLDYTPAVVFPGGEKIDPSKVKPFQVDGTWPRADLVETREAMIDVLFTVGTRGGELLISGLELPSASAFPGKPASARYPVFSYTYPTTSLEKLRHRALHMLRQTPRQRFKEWCRGSTARTGTSNASLP